MNILEKIVNHKADEVAYRKSKVSEASLIKSEYFNRNCYSLSSYIIKDGLSGIIAEFKRKSPSKPHINLIADSVKVTTAYQKAGTSACSILTDADFFGGSDDDMTSARQHMHIPLLRKDFVIDPYQIIEAKSIGADAILLIAEVLSKSEIDMLSKVATDCGLEVLMEIHTADQIKKYHDRIANIGVNNRNLKTFTTDIRYSKDIFPLLPHDTVKVSESGLHEAAQVVELKTAGYHGFLIGENFMKTEDPGAACAEFINNINKAKL
ncbi:MAG: indole-3-glycerol phosphate synthase TrpC [Saprospiraceae bacterium]|nr:indole-3-glycerol phosphate synthase TrpC [Saprospiraceae bacterium]